MTLRVLDALPVLVLTFGEAVNKVPSGARKGLENQKVMAFKSKDKVLALDVYPSNLETVRIWIEPPTPPSIPGVSILDSKKCADLERSELRALANGSGIYVEVSSRDALNRLIAWYK
ncbi:hypothetical protein [Pseudophaeobacter flagellatus]|uniref:hypothetical protein n=1 Tax=Pseudophaeobacter flagellatus TaxID=2899119 RepID=UPI001E30DF6D|nr:hypothetical protein [Pseudophaeobacter flagellatus]MCD9147186.1 hypothetical protein [Pseudophaeobacter flagellatus]